MAEISIDDKDNVVVTYQEHRYVLQKDENVKARNVKYMAEQMDIHLYDIDVAGDYEVMMREALRDGAVMKFDECKHMFDGEIEFILQDDRHRRISERMSQLNDEAAENKKRLPKFSSLVREDWLTIEESAVFLEMTLTTLRSTHGSRRSITSMKVIDDIGVTGERKTQICVFKRSLLTKYKKHLYEMKRNRANFVAQPERWLRELSK